MGLVNKGKVEGMNGGWGKGRLIIEEKGEGKNGIWKGAFNVDGKDGYLSLSFVVRKR